MPIVYAAEEGYLDAAKLFIAYSAIFSCKYEPGREEQYHVAANAHSFWRCHRAPLYAALLKPDVHTVELLLAHCGDVGDTFIRIHNCID